MAVRMKGVFCLADKIRRDGNGRILEVLPRTPEEVVEFILANSVRDEKTGCLVCSLRKDKKGYARVMWRTEIRVHRVIFYKGYLPKGKNLPHVLHTCDNRACVEETHLYLGTNKQNIADKVSRDRSGKKLNIAKVREIKAMLRNGVRLSRIGYLFGVDDRTIYHIKAGTRWAHVQDVTQEAGSVVKSPYESVG